MLNISQWTPRFFISLWSLSKALWRLLVKIEDKLQLEKRLSIYLMYMAYTRSLPDILIDEVKELKSIHNHLSIYLPNVINTCFNSLYEFLKYLYHAVHPIDTAVFLILFFLMIPLLFLYLISIIVRPLPVWHRFFSFLLILLTLLLYGMYLFLVTFLILAPFIRILYPDIIHYKKHYLLL